MASLKAIRTRITSVKSTQKITRAMKMVAGARLNRAQARILALRPYAVKTRQVLASCSASWHSEAEAKGDGEVGDVMQDDRAYHPLLVRRAEKRVLFLVLTSDRGLCGAFNANINRTMEAEWHRRSDKGQQVQIAIVGRKGHDFFAHRNGPIFTTFEGVWEDLGIATARRVALTLIAPFLKGEVDALYLVYNEFKSAMTQSVVVEPLLPINEGISGDDRDGLAIRDLDDFIFEPTRKGLLDRLVPMYVEVSIMRALLESNASEHGARMTAMDAATSNADEMIDALTLQYNRARQAAITTELSEIIGGAEALEG